MMAEKSRRKTVALLKLLRDPELGAEFLDHSAQETHEVVRALVNAYQHHRAYQTWKPKEKWRSKKPDENARAFFERVYMVLPYEERPYSHQLANEKNGDRDLYDALTMVITNNRRLDRTGEPGSLFAARSMADLMPMLGVERGAKRLPMPRELEELERVTSIRAQASRRAR